ncbi:MAG: hypothetical protein RIR97_1276, partial [Pseudomonadota bacterium]
FSMTEKAREDMAEPFLLEEITFMKFATGIAKSPS